MPAPPLITVVVPGAAAAPAYLASLNLDEFGIRTQNWCAWVAGVQSGIIDGQPPEAMDILFIQDKPLTGADEKILKAVFPADRQVGIVLHNGSTHKAEQLIRLRNVLGPRLRLPIYEHSTSGIVFDYLTQIGRIRTDFAAYESTLAQFRLYVCGDRILEAKLDLLHRCLTPEGAAAIAEIDQLGDLLQEQIECVLPGAEPPYTVATVVDHLAKQTDPFESSYIKVLSSLRDALLS